MSEKQIGKALICPKCGTTIYINVNVEWPRGKTVQCMGRWGGFKCDYEYIKGRDF